MPWQIPDVQWFKRDHVNFPGKLEQNSLYSLNYGWYVLHHVNLSQRYAASHGWNGHYCEGRNIDMFYLFIVSVSKFLVFLWSGVNQLSHQIGIPWNDIQHSISHSISPLVDIIQGHFRLKVLIKILDCGWRLTVDVVSCPPDEPPAVLMSAVTGG